MEHALAHFERELAAGLAHCHGAPDDRPARITLTVQ